MLSNLFIPIVKQIDRNYDNNNDEHYVNMRFRIRDNTKIINEDILKNKCLAKATFDILGVWITSNMFGVYVSLSEIKGYRFIDKKIYLNFDQ